MNILVGLKIEYDSTKNQLIGQILFTTVHELHGHAQLEESRRESMAPIATMHDRFEFFTGNI